MRGARHPFGSAKVVRQRPAWSPWALGSALVAWWSAEDLVNGAVAAWMSKKGGFNPVQGTGGSQPARAATSFNGFYPGVTFDGSADNLRLASTTGLPTGSTQGEIWFLGSWVTSAGTVVPIAYGGTGSNQRLIQKIAAGEMTRISDNSATVAMASGLGSHIVGGFFGSAAMNGRMDGVAYGPTAATLNTGTTRLTIGANNANTAAQFHNAVIAEIIITTGLLSAADRERIEGYWAWRYGLIGNLPNNHTYKEVRP